MVEEKKKLEEEYEKITVSCRKNPEDSEQKLRRLQVSRQIADITEQLRQLEDDLFALYERTR